MKTALTTQIKENSWIAKIAARKLKQSSTAVVVGSKILLYGVSKSDFLQNSKWLKHEMAHIRQFRQHGLVWFVILYLVESLKKGYEMNKFEIEARAAENN